MPTWIVTGASRGLGRAIALQLAAAGHEVLALARDRVELAALAELSAGARILPCPIDLADADALRPAIDALLAEHPRIDGLVNNAGIGSYKPFLDHPEAELRAILQVNLAAPIQLCRALLPQMLARRNGQIVNIGSDLGRRPLANMAAYVASKHGLTGFSHSLLREVKDSGVRVSLINPGIIDSGFGGAEPGSHRADGAMSPDALAALVLQVIEQPWPLVLDELTVHPMRQEHF